MDGNDTPSLSVRLSLVFTRVREGVAMDGNDTPTLSIRLSLLFTE